MDNEETKIGWKKILIIFSVLTTVVLIAFFLYLRSPAPDIIDIIEPDYQEATSSVNIVEIPRALSEDEKVLIEARATTSALQLTKKEKTSIGQKTQNLSGVTLLNETEKAKIEERIIIQTQ